MDRPRQPLHAPGYFIYPDETSREYIKLAGLILFLLLLSLGLTYGRGWGVKYLFQDFIAALLITSSAYKMFRLEVFVKIFKSYDLVAQRWPMWAYVYPFLELGIGADYLLSNGSSFLYFLTFIFLGMTIYSKIFQVKSRVHLQYACLDNLVRLPISTIDFIVSIIGFATTILVVIFS
jgi:hypothetical protein